jgi:predicted nucleic acid-binding protein
MEIEDSIVILDDYKARKIAGNLGINFTGTIGVIVKAKHSGIINSMKPLFEK